MSHRRGRVAFSVVALCLCGRASAHAAPPKVEHLFPSGARAGQTIEVTAIGSFDPWPAEAWVSSSTIRVQPQKDKGKLSVQVAAETAPGVYWIRLYNREGASALRPFVVGTLPEILEKEPNDAPGEAHRIDGTATINGRLDRKADLDAFSFKLEQGQTLVASLEANRHLLSPMDGIMQLMSSRGFVLEQNDDDHERDPQIVYTAPESDTYVLRLFAFTIPPNQSIRFANGNTYVYRLTLTTGPFLDHPYPVTLSTSHPGAVELCGWNVPPSLKRIFLFGTEHESGILLRHPDLGNTLRVGLVSHGVAVEEERSLPPPRSPPKGGTLLPSPRSPPTGGTDRRSTDGGLQVIRCPLTLSGRIDPPGDVDRYRFQATKGERFLLEIEARRLGSPIDPVLRVLDGTDKQLSRVDDSSGADPQLSFTVPADGEYVVEVTDLFEHGGFRYVYGLHMTRPRPDYRLSLGADQFVLKPGKTLEIPVTVSREHGFSGTIEVAAIGLPEGVKSAPVRSAAKGDTAKTTKLQLSASAGPFSGVIRVVGKEVGGANDLRTATYTTGGWNERQDLVWLTVLEKKG